MMKRIQINTWLRKCKNYLSSLVGALLAILITVIGILIYALLINWGVCGESGILIFCIVIKVLAVLIGCLFACHFHNEKGWLRGLLTAILYVILSHLICMMIEGTWYFGMSFLTELLMCSGVGMITGMIGINLSRKKSSK